MYIICYHSIELECNTWELVNGEDAMQVRVSELRDEGISDKDILVFDVADELDSKEPAEGQEV